MKSNSSVKSSTISGLQLETESSEKYRHVDWMIILFSSVIVLLIITIIFFASIDESTDKQLANENAERNWHVSGCVIVAICLTWFIVTIIKQFESFRLKKRSDNKNNNNNTNTINKNPIVIGIIRLVFVVLTISLSSIMILNKLHYNFWDSNILFINKYNFYYLNNMYKMLSIIIICLLWKACINTGNVKKLVSKSYP